MSRVALVPMSLVLLVALVSSALLLVRFQRRPLHVASSLSAASVVLSTSTSTARLQFATLPQRRRVVVSCCAGRGC